MGKAHNIMAEERTPVDVYIGIGSNLDNPELQLSSAISALKKVPQSCYIENSGMYRSKPLVCEGKADDVQTQPDYVNAVAKIKTSLAPEDLLDKLQAIESEQGRKRETHWGPRTLDLDILLYGEHVISNERLQIPHPGIPKRSFVLVPMSVIDPDLVLPRFGDLHKLLEQCDDNELVYLGDPS